MGYAPIAEGESWAVIVGSAVVLALAIVGFLAVKAISKWMGAQDEAALGAGFTLSDLRQLHKSGKMSSDEFEKAKAILLASAVKPVEKPKSSGPPTL